MLGFGVFRGKIEGVDSRNLPTPIPYIVNEVRRMGIKKYTTKPFYTTEKFIEKSIAAHGERYDYSRVEYESSEQRVTIGCSVHGWFEQEAGVHMLGMGCSKCGRKKAGDARRHDTEWFIKRARQVHGEKYDYGEAVYTEYHGKLNIRCPEHDLVFTVIASDHISRQKTGCSLCGKERMRRRFAHSKEQFVEAAVRTHGDAYNYSLVEYVNNNVKVFIVCRKHEQGWWIKPANHLSGRSRDGLGGNGCPICAQESRGVKQTKTTEQFILEARKIHGSRYDYSLVDYRGAHKKVEIVCPAHGSFWMNPAVHIFMDAGCISCNPKSRGEERIKEVLDMLGVWYSREVSFSDCVSSVGRVLRFDFAVWLNGETVLIEYDGQQHYRAIALFGGEKSFKEARARDETKTNYAERVGHKLIRIPYWDYERVPEIILREFDEHWKPIARYRRKKRVDQVPTQRSLFHL